MRVGIVGSRKFTDVRAVCEAIAEIFDSVDVGHFDVPNKSITIVSGGAQGVDSHAKVFADAAKCDFIKFEPHFLLDKRAEYSPRDYFTRNYQIVNNIDLLIAIWDGESKDTAHTIRAAKKKNIPVIEKVL